MSPEDHNGRTVNHPLASPCGEAAEPGNGASAVNRPAFQVRSGECGVRTLLDAYPWVRPVETPLELQALQRMALLDNHRVVGATHLVERRGEIVGYASLGTVRMLNVWVHSRKVRASESMALLNMAENLLSAECGMRNAECTVCTPCLAESPFYPHMERLGYENLGQAGFFLKRLARTKG